MTGYCAQCRRDTDVARYRLAYVGLRRLCEPCAEWMTGVGMAITAVTEQDPRRNIRRVYQAHHRRHDDLRLVAEGVLGFVVFLAVVVAFSVAPV